MAGSGSGGRSSSSVSAGGKKKQQGLRVWEVLDANDRARRAYMRVLQARPNMVEIAKNVLCLLLWLETSLGAKVLEQVSGMEMSGPSKDKEQQQLSLSLSLLVNEADGLYSYLLDGPDDALPESLASNIPTIVSICGGGGRLLDFGFFKFHKDLVARGVAVVRDTVAAIVFDDHLHGMMRRFEDGLAVAASSSRNNININNRPAPAPQLMELFMPSSRTPPEDSCTVFLAFSSNTNTKITNKQGGHPHGITPQDIIHHFERVIGFPDYIERVEIEQACAGEDSKHGIMVFKSPEKRKEAMFEETSAFFRIKSHDIWMQCYMPPF